jgi:hypothetical protein
MNKINEFYEARLHGLTLKFHQVFTREGCLSDDDAGEFVKALEDLRVFILVNTIAVIKIVKKRNKLFSSTSKSIDVKSYLKLQNFHRAEVFLGLLHNTDTLLAQNLLSTLPALPQPSATSTFKLKSNSTESPTPSTVESKNDRMQRLRRRLAATTTSLSSRDQHAEMDSDDAQLDSLLNFDDSETSSCITGPAVWATESQHQQVSNRSRTLDSQLETPVVEYLTMKLGSDHKLTELANHHFGLAHSVPESTKPSKCVNWTGRLLVVVFTCAIFFAVSSSSSRSSVPTHSIDRSTIPPEVFQQQQQQQLDLAATLQVASTSPASAHRGRIIASLLWPDIDVRSINKHLSETMSGISIQTAILHTTN